MNPTDTMHSAEPPPAVILRCAAVYIERHGWHYGDMFADPTQLTPAACAIGAIKMAVCGSPNTNYTPEQAGQVNHALGVLADHLTDFGYRGDLTELVDHDDENPNVIVGNWNDRPGRTEAEVILTLEEAAADWDRRYATTSAPAGAEGDR